MKSASVAEFYTTIENKCCNELGKSNLIDNSCLKFHYLGSLFFFFGLQHLDGDYNEYLEKQAVSLHIVEIVFET